MAGQVELTPLSMLAACAFVFAIPSCGSNATVAELEALAPDGFVVFPANHAVRLGNPSAHWLPSYRPNEREITVDIPAFAIARDLVTVAEFCEFLGSDFARRLDRTLLCTSDRCNIYWRMAIDYHDGEYRPRPGTERQPADTVTWLGAMKYCEWLTLKPHSRWRYRLPTEAEWEFAARGPTGRLWPWGDGAPDGTRGWQWVRKRLYDADTPWMSPGIGSFPSGATPEGVLDMLGYLATQWCCNRYVELPDPEQMTEVNLSTSDLFSDRVERGGYKTTVRRKTILDYLWIVVNALQDSTEARVWTRNGANPLWSGGRPQGFRVAADVSRL